MNNKSGSSFSRRQFARRAALLSATATLHPETILPSSQNGQNSSQLSPDGQREADARYQQILSLYGDHLDETQKASIKKMCVDLQPTLEKVRNFKLENGNAPALYLKPLVERDKKPLSAATAKKP